MSWKEIQYNPVMCNVTENLIPNKRKILVQKVARNNILTA